MVILKILIRKIILFLKYLKFVNHSRIKRKLWNIRCFFFSLHSCPSLLYRHLFHSLPKILILIRISLQPDVVDLSYFSRNSVWSDNFSLKYQTFTPSGCKYIVFDKNWVPFWNSNIKFRIWITHLFQRRWQNIYKNLINN